MPHVTLTLGSHGRNSLGGMTTENKRFSAVHAARCAVQPEIDAAAAAAVATLSVPRCSGSSRAEPLELRTPVITALQDTC